MACIWRNFKGGVFTKCLLAMLLVTGGLLLFVLFSKQNYQIANPRPDSSPAENPQKASSPAENQASSPTENQASSPVGNLASSPTENQASSPTENQLADMRDNATTTRLLDPDRKFVDNFAERRARLERVCEDQPSTRFTRAKGIAGIKKVRFSVCIVNKAASTMWRRFIILMKTEGRNSLQSRNKWDIHMHGAGGQGDRFNLYKDRGSVMKTRRALTARNPYSRLWSTYVDKFFFPEFPKLIREIIKVYRENATDKEIACGRCVTFNEFIRYVVDMNYTADVYTGHWLPVSDVCDPCTLRPDFIAKQETLGEDIKAIVQRLGLPYETDELFVKAQLETTIGDEISVHVHNYDYVKECVTKPDYLRQIWKGLVINGFLAPDAEFPEMFEQLPFNIAAISRYILQMPDLVTDSAMRSKLRREAMVNAFKQIPAQDLIGLQRLYRIDFLMFDYSTVSFL